MLAAAALFSAAPAQADPAADFAAGSAPVTAAEDIAKAYWQTTPCAGEVSLVWMSLTHSTNATSTWQNPVGQYDAPEQNTSCQIAFNKDLTWDWTRFCSILVHEYGHLSGHAHVADHADVMYAFYEAPVPQCVAAAPSQLVAAAPVAPAVQPAVLPALENASSAQPRAISSSRATKRGVLVVVREPRRHHHKHRRPHPRHRGHGRQHRKHRAQHHRVGHLARA